MSDMSALRKRTGLGNPPERKPDTNLKEPEIIDPVPYLDATAKNATRGQRLAKDIAADERRRAMNGDRNQEEEVLKEKQKAVQEAKNKAAQEEKDKAALEAKNKAAQEEKDKAALEAKNKAAQEEKDKKDKKDLKEKQKQTATTQRVKKRGRPKKEETEQFSTKLNKNFRTLFKKASIDFDMNMNDIMVEAISEWIDKKTKSNKSK